MRHVFEPTDGFPDECLTCCGKHSELILQSILAESQLYNRQALMPMYVEPEVTIEALHEAHEHLRLELMFGGGQ